MRQPKLSDSEVATRLSALPAWSLTEGMIRRTFLFPDFVAAIQFVNTVAVAAEAIDHHPDIDIRYNKVTLALITHDSAGLTVNDFALAEQADRLTG